MVCDFDNAMGASVHVRNVHIPPLFKALTWSWPEQDDSSDSRLMVVEFLEVTFSRHFSASLLHTDWSPVFSCGCVADQWTAFLQLFLPILDFHAPVKRLKLHNPSAPPVSDTTLRLMARRRGLLAHDGRTPAFLTLDKRVKAAIRRDVREDIASRVRRQGPASIFRNVRQVIEGKRFTCSESRLRPPPPS